MLRFAGAQPSGGAGDMRPVVLRPAEPFALPIPPALQNANVPAAETIPRGVFLAFTRSGGEGLMFTLDVLEHVIADLDRVQAHGFVAGLDRVLGLARTLDRALVLSLIRDLERTLVRSLVGELDEVRALIRQFDFDLDEDLGVAREFARDLALDLVRVRDDSDQAGGRAQELVRALDRIRVRIQAHSSRSVRDVDGAMIRALYAARSLVRGIALVQARNLSADLDLDDDPAAHPTRTLDPVSAGDLVRVRDLAGVRDLTSALVLNLTRNLVRVQDRTRDRLFAGRLGDVTALTAALFRGLSGDLSNCDLSEVDLTDADLSGVTLSGATWTRGTRWPSTIVAEIWARSAEIGAGVFQIDPDFERCPATDLVPSI
ncbi:pentapeptide repeat-containing protein [Streptosporangiaceae bacterium NEAU-GS5]|nr:pentapeptide repeat-containing protein [Streptosporangiaceae bacterium NEAU-GS5]